MDQVVSVEVDGQTFTGRYEVKLGCVTVLMAISPK